jgi:hypothetical protein
MEKHLTEDEISAELLADTLCDVPDDADSDSENDSDSSVIGNTKFCILYRVTVTLSKVQTKVTRTTKH